MSETVERQERRTESDVFLEVADLKTYYGEGRFATEPVKAVDGVSFDVRRGETLGLVGESGCGKTTLGRTLVRLEEATGGEVRYDGRDVTTLDGSELKDWRRNAQIVFQSPDSSLNDRMTVGEIIREPLDVHDWPNLAVAVEGTGDATVTGDVTRAAPGATGRHVDITVDVSDGPPAVEIRDAMPLRRTDVDVNVDDEGATTAVDVRVRPSKNQIRRAHARNLLSKVGMQEAHYYRYPHQFSGGQRQRIGIARALALEPSFVVLDEPVSALDVSVQAKILNLLEDLQEEFGLTYLFIAHDLSVVRHICDRVAVMYLGNIMELGPTEGLFEDPANPYTHSLLSAIPEPDPTGTREPITLRGTPPSPRYPPEGCALSTRCPAKIRPAEFADLDQELWEGIDDLARVIRERLHADRSVKERVRERLGMRTRFSNVEEIAVEAFGRPQGVEPGDDTDRQLEGVLEDLPPEARTPVAEIVDHLRENRNQAALDRLLAAFGSDCDAERPAFHEVDDTGRVSACHRHRDGYDDVASVIEERTGRE